MTDSTKGCKVDRIIEKYNLTNLNDRILRRRRNEDASLRDLDEYINERLIKVTLRETGHTPIDGEAATYHRHLRYDNGIAARDTRRQLEEKGVPVDELEDDFVSYQTIRKHLNECLGHDTSKPDYNPEPSEDHQQLVQLKGRAEAVIERTINRLRKHDAVCLGEPEAIVSMKVRCADCGRTHNVNEILSTRSCACTGNEARQTDNPPTSEHQ